MAFCLKLNHFREKSVINIANEKSNIAYTGCLKKVSFTEMSICRLDFPPTKGNMLFFWSFLTETMQDQGFPGHVMKMFNRVKLTLYHAVGWDINIIYPILLYHDYGPLQRSLRMVRCDVNIPSNRKDLYSMPQKGFPIPKQKLDWDISSQMRMLI